MDPFTIARWFGVCAEPPIEEAQPAWWLDLERSETIQRKAEEARSVTQHAVFPSAASSDFASGAEGRKVRFASEPTLDPHVFYENDAEFVMSPARRTTQTSPTQASERTEMAPWELSDLDDAADIRRMLIPTGGTPQSSSAGSVSANSLIDFHCGSDSSGSEPVFHEFYGSSVHSTGSGV